MDDSRLDSKRANQALLAMGILMALSFAFGFVTGAWLF